MDCSTLLDHQVGGGVCGCCGALRPRYKRLVDNIFPEDPEDGLVKANMEKLTFYALSAPEKLDRIGAYLSERLSRDVARHRYGYVCIAMEALDQLLMACHCQTINLFVESFLTMVRKLLEADKPNLQILGTNSFVKFANIEEDTPSYHRSYDFFVSRFSEMCHSSYEDPDIRTKIRMAGIKGLQGVVRKTVNDELQANIWDPQHMDKIVPSLLFNLQQEEGVERSPSPEAEKESPVELTERCFRELLGRAAYGNIKNAVKPVLMHLDNHSLWESKTFAVRCFKIIMYSIQSQHSHLVIQQLLGHLDANSKNSSRVRAGIVEVISEAAVIEASGSIEIYNTERLATPYIPQITDEDRLSKRKSIGDTVSLQLEMESRNSPEKEQRSTAEQITFETLKQAIVDSVNVEELERERRRQVVERFQTAPFEEIAAHCGARASLLQSKLNQIFEITIRPPPSPSGSVGNGHGRSRSIPVYEMTFPDLCVY
ncbi:protein EFR3 homolog B-like [Sinocyclocheilus grahami]|uniref:protein EFR3 homolog B-like n=1 Tax=Sinocyclocheilus grahami TaxID=75366 RepID=UPI0007AD258F|nr:PREDICTED: protein EFR3 homolog B-like [Sinocyclocheilus grahami]